MSLIGQQVSNVLIPTAMVDWSTTGIEAERDRALAAGVLPTVDLAIIPKSKRRKRKRGKQ